MVFHPFRARPYDGVRSKWTRSDGLIESWIHKNIPEKRNLKQILKQSLPNLFFFPAGISSPPSSIHRVKERKVESKALLSQLLLQIKENTK